jgi:hypothetical protein
MAKATKPDPERIAAAQKSAADELRARAATDTAIADILTLTHRRFELWRRCADRQCRRARGCRGDALACGARYWPVVCSSLEEIGRTGRHGRSAERLARQHLKLWREEDGVLTQLRPVVVGWLPPDDGDGP